MDTQKAGKSVRSTATWVGYCCCDNLVRCSRYAARSSADCKGAWAHVCGAGTKGGAVSNAIPEFDMLAIVVRVTCGSASCARAFAAYAGWYPLKLGDGLSVKCEGEKLRYGKLEKRVVIGPVAKGEGLLMCSEGCTCMDGTLPCDVSSLPPDCDRLAP